MYNHFLALPAPDDFSNQADTMLNPLAILVSIQTMLEDVQKRVINQYSDRLPSDYLEPTKNYNLVELIKKAKPKNWVTKKSQNLSFITAIKKFNTHNYLHYPSRHYVIKIPYVYRNRIKNIEKSTPIILISQFFVNTEPRIPRNTKTIFNTSNHIFKIPLKAVQYIDESLSTFYPHEQSWECSKKLYNDPIIISEVMINLLNKLKIKQKVMINEAYNVLLPSDLKSSRREIKYPLQIGWMICSIRWKTANKFLATKHRRNLKYYWNQIKYLDYVAKEASNIPLPFDLVFLTPKSSIPNIRTFKPIISPINPFQWSPPEKEHPSMQDNVFFPLIDDIKITKPIEEFEFPSFDIEIIHPPPEPPPPAINKIFECSEPDPPNFSFFYGKIRNLQVFHKKLGRIKNMLYNVLKMPSQFNDNFDDYFPEEEDIILSISKTAVINNLEETFIPTPDISRTIIHIMSTSIKKTKLNCKIPSI
jgi:hypothetical protein